MELTFSLNHERKIGRRVYSLMINRLRLGPPLSRILTKLFKVSLHPRQFLIRRWSVLFSLPTPPFRMERSRGYAFFKHTDVPFGADALNACDQIIRQARDFESAKDQNTFAKGKPWRANLLKTEHLAKYPELLKFATSPAIISAASEYLGTVPVLGDMQLWWTIANKEEQSSQLFHIDQEDFKQVKVFLHINDIGEDSGPVTFLPAQESMRILPKLKEPYLKASDEEFFSHTSHDKIVRSIGPRGSCAMLDTSMCYHQGSRTKSGERLVLMFNYVPYNCIREPNKEVLIDHEILKSSRIELTPITKLVL